MEVPPEERFKEKIVNQNSIFFIITSTKDTIDEYLHVSVEENDNKIISDKKIVEEKIEFNAIIKKLTLLYNLYFSNDVMSDVEMKKELYVTIAELLHIYLIVLIGLVLL